MTPPGLESLFILGLNHRTADVDIRERVARDKTGRGELRTELSNGLGLPHHVCVSTCNRTEIYGQLDTGELGVADREKIESVVFGEITGRPPYRGAGLEVVFHLYRVAAGIDSLVVGESEILGQVKTAFDEAREQKGAGRLLDDLFTGALRAGKRVRTETGIGLGSLSVAASAVKLASKIVGDLSSRRAVVVGAGETGRLVARHLQAAGIEDVAFCNRTLANAESAAAEFGGRAVGLDGLPAVLEKSDVLIASVETQAPIVTVEMVRSLRSRTRCLIDISVPRAIEKEVADQNGVFAFDIDDLGELVETTAAERASEIAQVDAILVEEAHKFLGRQTFSWLAPVVGGLRSSFDEVLEEIVSDDAQRREFEKLAARLFGVTVDRIKGVSRTRYELEDVRRAYARFLEDNE